MKNKQIDNLKILIAAISVVGSNILPLQNFEGTEEEIENETLKQYFIILLRAVFLFYSINYNWPLVISVIISSIFSTTSKIGIDKDQEEIKKRLN